MTQINVSDHLHNKLTELKNTEEHTSLDSVIRTLYHSYIANKNTPTTNQDTDTTNTDTELTFTPQETEELAELIKIANNTDNTRETLKEAIMNTDSPLSNTLRFKIAPLIPGVTFIGDPANPDESTHLDVENNLPWTCDNCRVERHHTTIPAIRLNEYGEINEVKCGSCGDWGTVSTAERIPVNTNQEFYTLDDNEQIIQEKQVR